jgi:hypothetical protein
MKLHIPGAERGQRFPDAGNLDPMIVIMKKGREGLNKFIFQNSKEFKQHMSSMHHSRKTYDVSQYYLKQLVYDYLTSSNRDENMRILRMNR